jgi:hypothetical protein
MKIKFLIAFILLTTSGIINAQRFTQSVRGIITDKDSKMPLPGVTVVVEGTNPLIGTSTDANGEFVLRQVPVGRQNLRFSFLGYKEASATDVEINSGKELVLNIGMEESVTTLQEVAVVGHRNKTQALNEMNSISARTFSVEESGRYAGSRNDVSRMASNYAGVTNGDDSRNDIVIRGNSPMGLLWKLEEMEIPSPNHFTSVGSGGGPVSMLNYNVISNSDFMTGAFAAEYGNASSGVFDIKLRNGNNQKHEYMLQAGALGTELMMEGPFKNGYKGSYLINYRFSTTSILRVMNINFGYSGQADYQDISYNVSLPVSTKGTLGIFGMGGRSIYKVLYKDKEKEDFSPDSYLNTNTKWISSTAASGMSYQHRISDNSYIKTIAGVSGIYEIGREDSVGLINYEEYPRYRGENYQYKLTLHTYIKSKLNARNKIKVGIIADRYNYSFDTKFDADANGNLLDRYDGNGTAPLIQAYGQWNYSFTDNLLLTTGLHYQYLQLNDDQAIEPRASIKWNFRPQHAFTLGYGLHSQMQSLPIYMVSTNINGNIINTNKNLKFSKSHQFVFGYNWMITNNTAIKAETYYQYLFDIPVTSDSRRSSFSAINEGMSYFFTTEDSLVNNGTGRNFGLELTLEKFFGKGYYYLVTASLFDSKYKGSDGVLRNTAFNGKYVFNVLAGKEFKINDRSKIMVDFKVTTAGGKRYTPIDYAASQVAKEAVRIESQAYSQQFKDYFRTDIKVTYRFNGLGKAQEVFINVDNVFNTKNVFAQTYDAGRNQLGNIYQLGIFPTFQYKIYF